jgi:hypothetical protein
MDVSLPTYTIENIYQHLSFFSFLKDEYYLPMCSPGVLLLYEK